MKYFCESLATVFFVGEVYFVFIECKHIDLHVVDDSHGFLEFVVVGEICGDNGEVFIENLGDSVALRTWGDANWLE